MPSVEALYDEGVDLKDQGDRQGAIAKLESAVALDPDHLNSHIMLSKLYVDVAEVDKAVAHARRIVEIEPDDPYSFTVLSVIYQRCGMIPEAEDAKYRAVRMQQGLED